MLDLSPGERYHSKKTNADTSMDKKMSKEQAKQLADEFFPQQPRNHVAAPVQPLGKRFGLRPLRHDFASTPFVPPAQPAWV